MGFSGTLASLAPSIEAGAQLAVEQINAQGGLYGFPVTMVRADTGLDAVQAQQAINRLAEEGVPAVVGALSSHVTAGAIQAAVKNRIVLVSPAATASALSSVSDKGLFFRTAPSDALQAQLLADLASQQEGRETVAIVYPQDTAGSVFAKNFKRTLKTRKKPKLVGEFAYRRGRPVFSKFVTKLLRRKPELLVLFIFPEDSELLLEAIQQSQYTGKFLLSDSMRTPAVATGRYKRLLSEALGTAVVSRQNDTTRRFEHDYAQLKQIGLDLKSPYRAEAYDAMSLLLLAIAGVGEKYLRMSPKKQAEAVRRQLHLVANPPGLPVSYQEFSKAIAHLKQRGSINYQGVSGEITWNKDGDNTTATFEVWRMSGGRIRTVKTVEWGIEASKDVSLDK